MPFADVLDVVAVVGFAGLLAAAALTDLTTLRVPNVLCVAICLLYPLYVLNAASAGDWFWSLALAIIVFAVASVLFSFDMVGGGDVKLLAATALWAGPDHMWEFLAGVAFAVAGVGLIMLTPLRHWVSGRCSLSDRAEAGGPATAGHPPYGVAIAIGGLVVATRLLGVW
jgi:prepilin peptidase CpaA